MTSIKDKCNFSWNGSKPNSWDHSWTCKDCTCKSGKYGFYTGSQSTINSNCVKSLRHSGNYKDPKSWVHQKVKELESIKQLTLF